MARGRTTNPWMRRHLHDPYVKEATRQGLRSRAAFKLLELDERERLIRPGMTVIDLGAAPGGWAQVGAEKVTSKGLWVGVDLLEIAAVPGARMLRGDVRDPAVQAAVEEALDGRRADLVLSDMAPNLSGVKPADEARSQELVLLAVDCARRWLKPDGVLLVKLFHGSGLDAVIRRMEQVFIEVGIRKPPASRSASSEVYALCRRLASGGRGVAGSGA